MENATEALKMAFAVLVFVMALSLAFMLVTQARATSDVIFTAKDDQEYVEDITSIGKKDGESYRIVGMDTVIPTIYRYAQENYGVIIIDGGKIEAIYDLVVENAVSKYSNEWKKGNKNDELNSIIGNTVLDDDIEGITDYYIRTTGDTTCSWNANYFKELFGITNGGKGIYKIQNPNSISCPWTSSTYNIMQRIKVDMYGGTYYFGGTNQLKYTGIWGETEKTTGFIEKYGTDAKFKEYYYAVKGTNQLTQEEEVDRIQIIYVKE